MKTPILVSKIRSNTIGVVEVIQSKDIAERKIVNRFLFPVTESARCEYNPNAVKFQYDYRIIARLNKFLKEHNLPNDLYLSIDTEHIIPVEEIPVYKTI